jgi:INO80 complex subunit C
MPPPAPPLDETHLRLLDELDITPLPRPFRNPAWKPAQRRNKNIKQIISDNARKEASLLATQNNSGATTPLVGDSLAPTDGHSTPSVQFTNGTKASPNQPNIAQAAQNLSTLVLSKNARSYGPSPGEAKGSGLAPTYTNIESAPSFHPASRKHYCDITGLNAPYLDPKTKLRYHNKEIFAVLRELGPGVAEQYLEARGAQVILK